MPRKAKPGDRIGKYVIESEVNAGALSSSYKATLRGTPAFLKQYKSPTPTVPWYQGYVEYQNELKRRVESTNARNFSYEFLEFFEESFGVKKFWSIRAFRG